MDKYISTESEHLNTQPPRPTLSFPYSYFPCATGRGSAFVQYWLNRGGTKETNTNRFFWNCHWLEIWKTSFIPLWDRMEWTWLWTQWSRGDGESSNERTGQCLLYCTRMAPAVAAAGLRLSRPRIGLRQLGLLLLHGSGRQPRQLHTPPTKAFGLLRGGGRGCGELRRLLLGGRPAGSGLRVASRRSRKGLPVKPREWGLLPEIYVCRAKLCQIRGLWLKQAGTIYATNCGNYTTAFLRSLDFW
jgi:hypothetical protein